MVGVLAVAAVYLVVVAVSHYARTRRERVDHRRWANAVAALARIHGRHHDRNDRRATGRLDSLRRVQGIHRPHVPGPPAGETPPDP